jgi:hypothetical protein
VSKKKAKAALSKAFKDEGLEVEPNGVVHAPAVDGETADAVVGRARGKEAKERVRSMLDDVAELGPGLHWPTCFRPHLVAAKKAAKEALRAEHGIAFRRDGDTCIVEALNGISLVRIVLPGEGSCAPVRAVAPKKAMKLLAAAEDEFARLWFKGPHVTILVDESIHKFKLIPPDLPFPTPDFVADKGARALSGVTLNGEALALIQKALAVEAVSLRQCKKGTIAVLPEDGTDTENCGFLALFNDVEREEKS